LLATLQQLDRLVKSGPLAETDLMK
jgi:hypothetical protein